MTTVQVQCDRCNRPFSEQQIQQHKSFCDRLPPPDELKKYRGMSCGMIADLFDVSESNVRLHIKALGIEQTEGNVCRSCGLIVSKYNKKRHTVCMALRDHFKGLTALQIRTELERIIQDITVSDFADMLDIPNQSLHRHMERLVMNVPTRKERQKIKQKQNKGKIKINIPLVHLEIALNYYSIRMLSKHLGMSEPTLTRIIKDIGMNFPSPADKTAKKRLYKKKHGSYPCVETIIKDGKLTPKNKAIKCPQCEMEIYNKSDAKFITILPPNPEVRREQPSRINQWTQEAIPLKKNGIKRSPLKGRNGKPLWQWVKDEDTKQWELMTYDGYILKEGDKFCRFCIADVMHEAPPTPPDWVLIN